MTIYFRLLFSVFLLQNKSFIFLFFYFYSLFFLFFQIFIVAAVIISSSFLHLSFPLLYLHLFVCFLVEIPESTTLKKKEEQKFLNFLTFAPPFHSFLPSFVYLIDSLFKRARKHTHTDSNHHHHHLSLSFNR